MVPSLSNTTMLIQVLLLVWVPLAASNRASRSHIRLVEVSAGRLLHVNNSATVHIGHDEDEGRNGTIYSLSRSSQASRHGKPADAGANGKAAKVGGESIEVGATKSKTADVKASSTKKVELFVADLRRALKKDSEYGRCPTSDHVANYGCGMEEPLKCECRHPWYLPASAYYCYQPGYAELQADSSEEMMRASVAGRCGRAWWLLLTIATLAGSILGCLVIVCLCARRGQSDEDEDGWENQADKRQEESERNATDARRVGNKRNPSGLYAGHHSGQGI